MRYQAECAEALDQEQKRLSDQFIREDRFARRVRRDGKVRIVTVSIKRKR